MEPVPNLDPRGGEDVRAAYRKKVFEEIAARHRQTWDAKLRAKPKDGKFRRVFEPIDIGESTEIQKIKKVMFEKGYPVDNILIDDKAGTVSLEGPFIIPDKAGDFLRRLGVELIAEDKGYTRLELKRASGADDIYGNWLGIATSQFMIPNPNLEQRKNFLASDKSAITVTSPGEVADANLARDGLLRQTEGKFPTNETGNNVADTGVGATHTETKQIRNLREDILSPRVSASPRLEMITDENLEEFKDDKQIVLNMHFWRVAEVLPDNRVVLHRDITIKEALDLASKVKSGEIQDNINTPNVKLKAAVIGLSDLKYAGRWIVEKPPRGPEMLSRREEEKEVQNLRDKISSGEFNGNPDALGLLAYVLQKNVERLNDERSEFEKTHAT